MSALTCGGRNFGAGRADGRRAHRSDRGVFGIKPIDAGEITIKGKRVQIKSPRDAIRHGMALLTEDRKLTGIMGVLSCATT
jgi:methyl-galactoside transport system ATP-binding protein